MNAYLPIRPRSRQLAVLAAAGLLGLSFQAAAAPVFNAANGHYYEAFAGPLTWSGARAAADGMSYAGLGGHLATITDAAEQAFLEANLPVAAFGGPGTFGYWIGGYRAVGAGGFSWVTGEAFGYTNWNTGEPNFDTAPSGIHFFGQSSPKGKWNDASSESWSWGYVVEYSRVPEPASLLLVGLALSGLAWSRRERARSPAG